MDGLEAALAEHTKRVEVALATRETDHEDLQRRLEYTLGELRRRDETEVARPKQR